MKNPLHPLARALATTGVSLVLAACSSLNPFASRADDPAPLPAFKAAASLQTMARVNVGEAEHAVMTPAVAGRAVFAAGGEGEVVKVQDGRTVWKKDLDTDLSAGVGSDGRLVTVVTSRGELIALDADDGVERWRADVGAEVLDVPVVNSDYVIVRASDSRLIAFAAVDGARKWTYQRNTPALVVRSQTGMTLVEDKLLIVGYPGGKLVGILLDTGAPVWELTLAAPRGVTELERISDVVGEPAFAGQDVCAVAFQGKIGCFDLSNGRPEWLREFSSTTGLDRDVRFLVATADDNSVQSFDIINGTPKWQQKALQRRQVSRPLIVGDYIAMGDVEGYVHLLDRETGDFVARAATDGSAIVAPPRRIDGSTFAVQTAEGGVFVFDIRTATGNAQ